MRKSRVIKIIFTLVLTVSILLCSSVFVSAYFPIVNIESDEWDISTEMTYSAVYPDRINEFAYTGIVDDCFSYSDLNGQTYYGSCFWRDDYPYLTESEITIPSFPTGDGAAFGDHLSKMNKFVFRLGDTLYLAFFFGCQLAYDDSGVLYYQSTSWTGEIDVYSLSYPYSNWSYHSCYYWYDISDRCSIGFGNVGKTFSPVWSDVDLYSPDMSSVIHPKDNYDLVGTSYTLEYTKPLSVLTGALSFELSASELKFLSAGACCILIDDIGLIAGTYTSFLHLYYCLYIYDSLGNLVDSDIIYAIEGITSELEAGEVSINDSVCFNDFDMNEYDYSSYSVELQFIFVSDGYNLFFPGTFEIIEFESYEDDMEHKEVVSCINEASSVVAGEISSARSELSSEIADAASNISTSINTNFNELMHGDTGYAEPSFDTSVIDSVSTNTDSTLDDIFSTLDKKILDNLPSGYSSFDMYLQDNVDTLNTRFSYAFLAVRNLFDRFVGATDITILILFSLVFGFAMYVLGRRLKS